MTPMLINLERTLGAVPDSTIKNRFLVTQNPLAKNSACIRLFNFASNSPQETIMWRNNTCRKYTLHETLHILKVKKKNMSNEV